MAKGKKGGNLIVWAILGLLVISLAGFGIDGFGTTMRTIGQVGDRDIDADEYQQALRNEVQAASQRFNQAITMEQAFTLGLDRRALQGLILRAAFDNEADRIGLSVGDERVQEQVLAQPGFQGLDGGFNRESYRLSLRNAGLTEPEFERQLRDEIARSIFQAAIYGGVRAPEAHVDAILTFLAERRSFTRLALTRADLSTSLPEPDEATLRAYYDAHPDQFTAPEAREITYAWITPDMLAEEITIDEARIQTLYDQRADQYRLPERRLVERLIFDTEAAAAEAMNRIGPDGEGFDAVVADRGFTLSDIDLGDVTREDLGEAADEIFAAAHPAVLGPLPSPFGPAIYRINGALAAQVTPLEEVRDELAAEVAADQTRRQIDSMIEDVNDLLASGATLEEVAQETELELGSIAYHEGQDAGIAAYPEFRARAAQVSADDFPEVFTLNDGGIAALRLDGLRPAAVRPFDEVGVRVVEAWAAAETETRLRARAEEIVKDLNAGRGFADQGLAAEAVSGVTRDGFVEGAGAGLIEAVFAMDPGETRILSGANGAVEIVRLDSVQPPDTDNPDVRSLRENIAEALSQGMAQDAFAFFSRALQDQAGISLNTTALEQINALLRGTGTGGAPRGGM
jgi:peptidyl-prolyl cis-trans isomerase D